MLVFTFFLHPFLELSAAGLLQPFCSPFLPEPYWLPYGIFQSRFSDVDNRGQCPCNECCKATNSLHQGDNTGAQPRDRDRGLSGSTWTFMAGSPVILLMKAANERKTRVILFAFPIMHLSTHSILMIRFTYTLISCAGHPIKQISDKLYIIIAFLVFSFNNIATPQIFKQEFIEEKRFVIKICYSKRFIFSPCGRGLQADVDRTAGRRTEYNVSEPLCCSWWKSTGRARDIILPLSAGATDRQKVLLDLLQPTTRPLRAPVSNFCLLDYKTHFSLSWFTKQDFIGHSVLLRNSYRPQAWEVHITNGLVL